MYDEYDKQEAQVELMRAEARLKEAEADLKQAEARLKNAEAKKKEAEALQIKAGVDPKLWSQVDRWSAGLERPGFRVIGRD